MIHQLGTASSPHPGGRAGTGALAPARRSFTGPFIGPFLGTFTGLILGLLWLVGLAGIGACSGSRSDPVPAGFPELKDPSADAQKKPRGWKAYTGERTTTIEGFGPGRNATVYRTDGTSVNLDDLWKDSNVVLVFYRGHW